MTTGDTPPAGECVCGNRKADDTPSLTSADLEPMARRLYNAVMGEVEMPAAVITAGLKFLETHHYELDHDHADVSAILGDLPFPDAGEVGALTKGPALYPKPGADPTLT